MGINPSRIERIVTAEVYAKDLSSKEPSKNGNESVYVNVPEKLAEIAETAERIKQDATKDIEGENSRWLVYSFANELINLAENYSALRPDELTPRIFDNINELSKIIKSVAGGDENVNQLAITRLLSELSDKFQYLHSLVALKTKHD